jgi:uncharacterized membrane protein YbhN (UPF0104 family)
VAASLAATALGYAALTGYDALGLRYLGRVIPYRRVALAGFVAYAFANSLPLSFVVGASVRYRYYSDWGLSPAETSRLVGIGLTTYAAGLLAAAALSFLLEPSAIPGLLHLPIRTTFPLGAAAALLVLLYLGATVLAPRVIAVRGWTVRVPSFAFAVTQVLVSLLDWILSGAALLVLLPPGQGVTVGTFFGLFILAQLVALVAQLPAGLGVFDAVMVWGLRPLVPPPAVLAALLAYRAIYFLLPLLAAALCLAGRQLRRAAAVKASS